ncbi:DeoR/GlpR family DNA-binding transcription regulator [Sporolactobacillus sp. STCC-11]|uniref:DeoR/GlpR family DNA-binding transcription regulator n=1 Tax=Sporolactobacillus caesalpiniae TaxID=3230362 RepID=UPI0033992848
MHQEKRIALIKQLVTNQQEITTKEIMERFNISQDTARRDIILLTERGEARRTHGGILAINYGTNVPNYEDRLQKFTKQKIRIAMAALNYIKNDGVYFIDVSTILLKLCQNLNKKVTVFTHSLDNSFALAEQPEVSVNLFGGRLHHKNRFFYGLDVMEKINDLVFDVAFVAASGIDERGIYFVNEEDAEIVQRVVKHSRKVILVAENHKFDNHSFYRGSEMKDIDVFITDKNLSTEQRAFFSNDTRIEIV